MRPTPIRGVAIITQVDDVDMQVRLCRSDAVALAFKSCTAAERYFDKHLNEVDIVYLDLDSVDLPVPPMAYMIGLWRRRRELDIFLLSESMEKLLATGVKTEHYVILPIPTNDY